MARVKIISATLAVTVAFLIAAPLALAQEDLLTDHIWVGGTGNQEWQVDENWDPTPFPNDPDREDMDEEVIEPVVGANLSVDLGADLTVDMGATDVTVAALTLGGTSGAVTTDVTSGGAGRLVFENFELNKPLEPDPNDPDAPTVECAFNCGAALITSRGVSGATNTISAIIGVNDRVEVEGTNDLTLSGNIQEMGTSGGLSAITPGQTVFVTGNITLLDMPPEGGEVDAPFALNAGTNLNASNASVASSTSQGTIDVSGVIQDSNAEAAARLFVGTGQGGVLPSLGTVILRGANTYSGRTFIGRGNVVLANDQAFGANEEDSGGVVQQSGPANQVGYNLMSDNDSRVIANDMAISQWQTVKGEHSLEWAGRVWQDNARGWINVLPEGKTLTLSGGLFPNRTEEDPPLPGRILTLDGSGRTVITGGLHDEFSSDLDGSNPGGQFVGSFRFRGSGTYVVSGGNSTYTGDTIVQGGNVHFATNDDFGGTAQIVSSAGAVGVDAGVIGNNTFLLQLNAEDHGGLMLGTDEYGMDVDFTSGSLASAANMSLAAHETGSEYTGTITPANDTYRLGGGSGTLTLPNANQLTGNRNLVATNGGEVRLEGANNYTGSTTLTAKYTTSLQNQAAVDSLDLDDDDLIPDDQMYVGTTLAVTNLADGGSSSSIGSSSSDAENLFIQGSTLKFEGGATSTDRLFTIGTGGATIDASGTGALNFTNNGALGVDIAEERTGNVSAFATGNTANDRITIRNLTSTDDLQPGMPIMSPDLDPMDTVSGGIPEETVITRIVSPTEVQISNQVGSSVFVNDTAITFGPALERTLTLTGSNTDDNTLASVIEDASDGGVVGVTKTGEGKWILTGDNTYTGDTSVEAGILSITNPFLADDADVLLTTGATFDLDFSGIDTINALFFDDASQAAGTWGATGSGADFESDFFTGSGLLDVSMMASTGLVGDYNNNGVVDAADYTVWRDNLGGSTLNNRDPDNMGAISQDDYDSWKANFGATSGAGSALGSAAVPEPGTIALTALALLAVVFGRRLTAR